MAVKRTAGGASTPPLLNIIMVAVALIAFLATVALAVSLLNDENSASNPSSNSENSNAAHIPMQSMAPESAFESLASVVSSSPANSSSSKSSSKSSSLSSSLSNSSSAVSSSSAPVLVFNPNGLGASGKANIAAAKAKNSHVEAWLRVPGTNISHPVLHHPTDVNYYMALDINKNNSKNGVLWADPDASFGSASNFAKNTVIYGHNWTNVSANPRIGDSSDVMFGQLTAFHHLNFAVATPYIFCSTETQEMTWKVFASFYTDISFNYIEANPSDANLSSIISGAKARSRHNYTVDVNSSDKILTLSTCTRAYGSSDKQRFVVMARLLRPGEETTAVTITSNPSPVLPRL